MTKAHTALVLEVASFFMVTLDLYGAERVRALGDRLVRVLERLKAGEDLRMIRIATWLLGQLISVIAVVIPIYRDLFPQSALIAARPGLRTLALIALAIVSFRLGAQMGRVALWLLASGINSVATVFERTRLEGILLVVGSALFVLSKVLSW